MAERYLQFENSYTDQLYINRPTYNIIQYMELSIANM